MRLSILIASSLAAVVAAETTTLHFMTSALESASDADAPPMLQHYGKPPDGCDADEQAFSISGIPGSVRYSFISVD